MLHADLRWEGPSHLLDVGGTNTIEEHQGAKIQDKQQGRFRRTSTGTSYRWQAARKTAAPSFQHDALLLLALRLRGGSMQIFVDMLAGRTVAPGPA